MIHPTTAQQSTITLTIPDSPHIHQVLQYLRDQVAEAEIEHWKSEHDSSKNGTEEEEEASGMLQAWEGLAEALDEHL